MSDLQAAKSVAKAFHAALDDPSQALADTLKRHLSPDHLWRGFHPFNEVTGPEALVETFWQPLHESLTHLQRREDVFFAGQNRIAGQNGTWVASMGHLMGLFDAPFLGIPPTGKLAFLRYAEFLKIDGDRITETAMFFDVPHLMDQAGISVFGPQRAAELVQPGPATHDGILLDRQDPGEGDKTLKILNQMIANLGQWQSDLPLEEELRLTWDERMLWWGPTGIGATYTIERYAKQHAGPFRANFSARSGTGHIARIAEGHYAGFFGWPNFTARLTGDFLGLPASDTPGAFRVIDMYRRKGDKLVENWIFIDLLHFAKTQGRDMLAEALAKAR
ncbi:MAG: SnoaL-like domain-containing protein [Silicimonas sp.]|nr:SnoaL-like domain-containing protein [Silicimonas sp.]